MNISKITDEERFSVVTNEIISIFERHDFTASEAISLMEELKEAIIKVMLKEEEETESGE